LQRRGKPCDCFLTQRRKGAKKIAKKEGEKNKWERDALPLTFSGRNSFNSELELLQLSEVFDVLSNTPKAWDLTLSAFLCDLPLRLRVFASVPLRHCFKLPGEPGSTQSRLSIVTLR
jgi:hypothetical protein